MFYKKELKSDIKCKPAADEIVAGFFDAKYDLGYIKCEMTPASKGGEKYPPSFHALFVMVRIRLQINSDKFSSDFPRVRSCRAADGQQV